MRDYEVKSNSIVVDFTKDTGVVIPKKMIYTSGDINTSYIRITCNNNDKPIDLFRYEININIVRKDGLYLNTECTVVDAARGEIEVMLTTSMLYVGLNHLEVMLSIGDKQLVSPMIPYKVVTSISSDMDENIPNTNEYPILIQLIGEVKALPEKLDRELTPIVKGKIDLMNKTIQDGNQYLEYANSNEAERQSNEEVRKTQELSRQESIKNMTSSFNNKVGEVNAKILETTNITNENTKKIDNKIVDIQSQLDTRVTTKFTEVDGTVSTKLTQLQNQVDAKILDVDASKDNMISTVNSKIVEVDNAKTDMVSQVGNKIVDADGKIVDCENRMQVIENTFDDLVSGTGYATTQYVDTKVSGIVNSAPEALDTLKELSDALGNDPNFAASIATQIGEKANKVDVYNKQEVDNAIANITIDTSNLATKEDVGLVDMKTETNKSDILTVKNELEKSVNNKYFTLNGIKEFSCKNGYVDNIYMEGKTLVNLFTNVEYNSDGNTGGYAIENNGITIHNHSGGQEYTVNVNNVGQMLDKNKTYTFMIDVELRGGSFEIHEFSSSFNRIILSSSTSGYFNFMYNPGGDNVSFRFDANAGAWVGFKDIMIIEGDYTNKPISYIEGLKSVGQGDKIEVLSYKGENLIDKNNLINGVTGGGNGVVTEGTENRLTLKVNDRIKIDDSKPITYITNELFDVAFLYLGDLTTVIKDSGWQNNSSNTLIPPKGTSYISINFRKKDNSKLNKSEINNFVITQDYDKKQISTTLRSLPNGVKDEVVKMGNSYYKLEKYAEIIVDDKTNILSVSDQTNGHIYGVFNVDNYTRGTRFAMISDRFKTKFHLSEECIFGEEDTDQFYINILANKLTTVNVEGFKAWLKDNPVTIVYELAEPKLIPLPNFNPMTFGDTTLLLNTGVVQGECNFEVTNSLGSEIEVLKDKVSNLDNYVVDEEVYYPTLLNGWTDRYSSNPIKISKVGNIVIIEGNLISGVVSANTHIMTLPNKVLPKRNMFTTIISRGSKIILGTFNITLDGRVIVQDNGFGDASTSSGGICFSYSYSLI
ncbi:MAG: BppU family phage baseplate upper protein [Cetobacterium sp.]